MKKHRTETAENIMELAMKITSDRTTWTLRAWVLAELLKRHGIDADFILRASKEELVKLLEAERGIITTDWRVGDD